ncbi:basic proline-rich protein-like protein [Lates japonicus]|uniref:Basic proline-rich protein-like protein n=1 Tax=Lates japonicus TaxID=270547 RepID=A0AAD3ML56_LATJO|nr:basic proline-rich protein-like protein [Lates japonicus]
MIGRADHDCVYAAYERHATSQLSLWEAHATRLDRCTAQSNPHLPLSLDGVTPGRAGRLTPEASPSARPAWNFAGEIQAARARPESPPPTAVTPRSPPPPPSTRVKSDTAHENPRPGDARAGHDEGPARRAALAPGGGERRTGDCSPAASSPAPAAPQPD